MSETPILATSETPILALARKPQVGLELTVEPTALTTQGLGRAELHVEIGPQKTPQRYAIEVRGALPGERVRARVVRIKRRTLRAKAIELLSSDPRRETPRCRHAGPIEEPGRGCGGCALQHVDHRTQLEFKILEVRRIFAAQGLDDELLREPLAPRDPWYYRNKMEYSFARGADDSLCLGLHPPGYHHEVLPLTECYLLSPLTSKLLPALGRWANEAGLRAFEFARGRGWLRTLTFREGKHTGERMLELCTTDAQEVMTAQGMRPAEEVARRFIQEAQEITQKLGGELTSIYWTEQHTRRGEPTRLIEHLIAGAPTLAEELHLPSIASVSAARTLRFEIHPRAFFQPNTFQAEVLYGEVLRAALVAGDPPLRPRALDLYCGTGTIGLCLAPACDAVVGVELSAEAVDNARRNALQNQIDNATFYAGDAGKILENELIGERGRFDLVVVDPPRAGLSPQALQHIGHIDMARLVYVSCNPESLARDLLALRRRGLEARYVQPVDMFPHTGHIENVVLLERA